MQKYIKTESYGQLCVHFHLVNTVGPIVGNLQLCLTSSKGKELLKIDIPKISSFQNVLFIKVFFNKITKSCLYLHLPIKQMLINLRSQWKRLHLMLIISAPSSTRMVLWNDSRWFSPFPITWHMNLQLKEITFNMIKLCFTL